MFLREKLPFFRFILKGFFSKQRKRYQLVCFLTRPILSPNSFGALHPQFDETVFECHFLFLLTLQVQVSSCLLPNFWGNFGASLFWGGAIWIFCFTHISLFFVCSLAIKFLSSHWTHQSIPKLSGFLIPSCVNFFWFYENHTICFIQVGTLQIVFMPKSTYSYWLIRMYQIVCFCTKHTIWHLPIRITNIQVEHYQLVHFFWHVTIWSIPVLTT